VFMFGFWLNALVVGQIQQWMKEHPTLPMIFVRMSLCLMSLSILMNWTWVHKQLIHLVISNFGPHTTEQEKRLNRIIHHLSQSDLNGNSEFSVTDENWYQLLYKQTMGSCELSYLY
jgi:hypothetical protein